MAWRRIGDKPLSEPMLIRLSDTYAKLGEMPSKDTENGYSVVWNSIKYHTIFISPGIAIQAHWSVFFSLYCLHTFGYILLKVVLHCIYTWIGNHIMFRSRSWYPMLFTDKTSDHIRLWWMVCTVWLMSCYYRDLDLPCRVWCHGFSTCLMYDGTFWIWKHMSWAFHIMEIIFIVFPFSKNTFKYTYFSLVWFYRK